MRNLPVHALNGCLMRSALAADDGLQEAVISVDTFYSAVAREAVAAGAHIVNDVSGGDLDPAMHAVVRVASASP